MFDEPDHDFLLVDVREPEEFRDWKIQGSLNIPLGDQFASRVKSIQNHGPIVTVCRTGVRSLYAVNELQEAGVVARSLRGGMVGWSNTYVWRNVPLPNGENARVFQIRRLSKGCMSYLIADGKECAVVDASSKTREYSQIANEQGLRIVSVIDTHRHADHVSGSWALANESGAELYLSGLDGYEFRGYHPIYDDTAIGIGESKLEFRAIHTPGHTPGSTCILLNDRLLFSGDTLLLDGVGRPDLHGSVTEAAERLYESVQKMFVDLDKETIVLPAHLSPQEDLNSAEPFTSRISDIESIVGRTNLSDSDSVKTLASNLPKPANYEAILRINSRPEGFDTSLCDLLEEGPNRCSFAVKNGGGL